MISVAMMPAIFQLCIGLTMFLIIDQLFGTKTGSFDGVTDIDKDHVALKADGIYVKGPWGRRGKNITGHIKDGGMAGALKLFALSYPGNRTSQVSTFSGDGEKTAIVQPGNIEMAFANERYRAGREISD